MPAPGPVPEPARGRMVCAGCGTALAPDDPRPFRCPDAASDDDVDHVLRPDLPGPARFPRDRDPQPFARYRQLSLAYDFARAHGRSDLDYVELVRDLDAAVAAIGGRRFVETPFERGAALSAALGCAPEAGVWIKNETGNVAGSHKARHLFGIMLWLRIAEPSATASLAIASCGNAALAAAVVARAAERDLEVFVPPDAAPPVLRRLRELGARLVTCARTGDRPGDPCVHAFHAAVAAGALPFGCQGNDNGLTIEGGKTLGFEIVDALSRQEQTLDALFVQVGGGALASATVQALAQAHALGAVAKMPRLHAVQTTAVAPLARAYDRVAGRIATRLGIATENVAERARQIRHRLADEAIESELHHAAHHRSSFMAPWQHVPESLARGILDDETYDWHAVVTGMLRSGGYPVTADESTLRAAHDLARAKTGIEVCPTGTAGLAGLLALRERGDWHPGEQAAVLFTGISRPDR